ncbi:MAG: hypothetical protein JWN86_4440 [Planctomycetota bacterium]|nr:hypothetical protein [Planctomycetota bacterium]
MASGLSWVWLLTWSLWAAVVFKDWQRQPRDWRWMFSLGTLVIVAWSTIGSLDDVNNLRFILLAGLAVVVLLSWTWVDLAASRRRSRRADWAGIHGYEPLAIERRRSSSSLPDGLRRLPMFSKGFSPATEGVMVRDDENGRQRFVFDHTIRRKVTWFDAGGVGTTGTVVAMHRPGMWLPLFQVRPIGIMYAMDGGPLGDPVAVGAGTAFAKSYRLGGHEPRNLRGFFSDELLAAISEKPGWVIEGEGEWIAACYFDRSENLMSLKASRLRIVKAEQLEDHVRDATLMLGRIADRDARSSARGVGAA